MARGPRRGRPGAAAPSPARSRPGASTGCGSRSPRGPAPRPGGRRPRRRRRAACRCAAQRPTICSRKLEEAQAQHVVAAPHPLVLAVGGEEELLEVVAADRDEVGQLRRNGRARRRGSASPASRRSCSSRGTHGRARCSRSTSLSTSARAASNSRHSVTKGNMIVQRAAPGAADQRLHLHPHDARPVEPDPDRAPAERRVRLVGALHVGQHLVRADVEGAEHHRLVARRVEDAGVERGELARASARWCARGTAARCGTGRRRPRRTSAGSAGRPSARRSCAAAASRRRGSSPACRAAPHRRPAPRAACRPSRGRPWRRSPRGAGARCPRSPSTRIGSPFIASRVMRAAWMTSGIASARATMAAWLPTEPSSSTTPRSLRP